MRAVANMPGQQRRSRIVDADVDPEMTVALVDFGRDGRQLSGELFARLRLHGHAAGSPILSRPASISETPASSFSSRRSATTTTGRSPGMAPAS